MSFVEPMVTIDDNPEVLEIIREEHISPTNPYEDMKAPTKTAPNGTNNKVKCIETKRENLTENNKNQEAIDKLLQAKEESLNAEFEKRLDREVACLKDRFDFILQNEQIRASHMLSEAHRERQEKIQALQTQLESKNLAGLMYVMCSERKKSKLEKLRIKEEYSGYIRALQDILTEGQELILNLSRGYKTAARVDHEWRKKMKKVMTEFQLFVTNFAGGNPESNQFFFDLPALLKTETSTVDDPNENPCDDEEVVEEETCETNDKNNCWWEKLDDENRPFVMFGDMIEFNPPQRREVLKHVKAAKTAPKKWKEYVFNNMFLNAECSNANIIKDEYTKHVPIGGKWDSQAQTSDKTLYNKQTSKMSITSRRLTTTSVDVRGTMGSILKMITSAGLGKHDTRATLLGARDSMEIVSTTKLRDRLKRSEQSKVTINVGNRRASIFEQIYDEENTDDYDLEYGKPKPKRSDEEVDVSMSDLGSFAIDSLDLITAHVPDQDHKVNYEKVCPMEECNRTRMNSFMRSLPPYMKSSPYTLFKQSFDEYEACSPEQLAILKQRLEEKKKKERVELDVPEKSPLVEWNIVDGVGVQTSDLMMMLPPCTCDLHKNESETQQRIFNLAGLFPVKQTLNKINKKFFFDHGVVFDRFKVIGQESVDVDPKQPKRQSNEPVFREIKETLKQHPSLLEIFQANTQC